jgi:low affinity Fe/Cu permease
MKLTSLFNRKTLLAATTVAVLSASSLSLADGHGKGHGWGKKFDQVEMQEKLEERLEKMKTELNLTPEQIKLMEKGHAARMEGGKTISEFRDSLSDEQKTQMKEMRMGKKFDQAKMQKKFEERLEKMKTELNLTPEQIELMEKGHAARMEGGKTMSEFRDSLSDEQKAKMKELRKDKKKGKKSHKKGDYDDN